ncbi:MAG TPA: DUF302 domain-containing protein [Thermoanaerobaculia bacterium]|nr:DUF302 domain-containing protein [Thermoanaerobaculia bacterium]
MSNVYERTVAGDIESVGQRLEQAVKDRSYGVLGQIDLRQKMRDKGLAFEPACRVYEVCNPARARTVLERDLQVSTALPCRIALYERAGRVHVATLRPSIILAAFDRPELAGEAEVVEADLIAILDQVASGS